MLVQASEIQTATARGIARACCVNFAVPSIAGDDMGRIDWRHIDEKDFNALVEALLVREHTQAGVEAHALSGRGGDDGIDVEVRVKKTEQLIHTFQLKYFPGGFSGGLTTRRAQIKKSMLRAIASELPSVWTLVVPTNPTARERKAVRGMRGGARMTVRFLGPAEMDGLLAKHPDIEARFTSDGAVELLAAVHRPEAALTKPGDLHSEISRMQKQMRGRSEYWAPAVSFAPDGTYVETLRPLRPDAQEREPLNISLTLEFTPHDIELREQFEKSMKFGSVEPLLLPERVVRSISKSGPEWFAEEGAGSSIELRPMTEEHVPVPVVVEVRDASQRVTARLTGKTTAHSSGFGGATVCAVFEGGLTHTWQFPRKTTDAGSVDVTTDFAGHSAREIRRALRFLEMLATNSEIGISVDGSPLLWMSLGPQKSLIPETEFVGFIDDLKELEDYFDVTLRYPVAGADASDRLWTRILVKLLRGEAVVHPDAGTFGGTLNGTLDEGLKTILTDGAAITARSPGFTITLFDVPLHLDELAYYTHHAIADNAGHLLRVLRDGQGEDERIEIRPIEDLPWVIYSPAHLKAAGVGVIITQPWAIDGMNEHPKYDLLPNAQVNQDD